MQELTPQQQKRLKKVAEIVANGEIAIAKHILELEDKFEQAVEEIKQSVPDLDKVLETIKGKDGENGDNYVITDDDKKEMVGMVHEMCDMDAVAKSISDKIPVESLAQRIADKAVSKIKVPIVEKVIEKTETKVEIPVVTNQIVEVAVADTPDKIRDKLESLTNDERLKIEAIKDLREELDELKKKIVKTGTVFQGGGIIGRDLIKDIDISSQLDGVTKTFNIQAVWNIVSVHLSSFPHALRKTTDFTYTPTSITFTSEIDASRSLRTGDTCVLTVVSG